MVGVLYDITMEVSTGIAMVELACRNPAGTDTRCRIDRDV